MQPYFRAVSFRRVHEFIPSCFRTLVCAVLASVLPSPVLAENTIVRMEINFGNTPAGNIDIELYDDQAPKTVTNFLRYAGRGNYNNIIMHRSIPGFIVQGGGHTYLPNPFTGEPIFFKTPADNPIQNEFSPARSNLRGTIAMAKLPDNPDSATNEWFFNLADNSGNLDAQNGGFTVFGRVLDTGPGTGMDVIDAIAGLPRFDGANNYPFYYPCNPSPPTFQCTNPTYFAELPTVEYDSASYVNGNPATYLQPDNLVYVARVPNVKSVTTIWGTLATFTADPGMTFNSAETFNPAVTESMLAQFTPPPGTSAYHPAGILAVTLTGTMDPAGENVTLHHAVSTNPNRYYAYGPTPDNPTDHWYDFSYDGETGAEIVGSGVRLHFVDGLRGDHDLAVNNSISHTGAPVLITENDTGKLSGCTITSSRPGAVSHGDWIMVAMFMAFLGLVRKRARR